MIFKIENEQLFIHCCICNEWKNYDTETYREGENLEIIRCLGRCPNRGNLLGYNWDLPEKYRICQDSQESPTITHIKIMSGLIRKNIFIWQFLKVVYKKLNQQLPNEDYESDFIQKAWQILKNETRHIASVI